MLKLISHLPEQCQDSYGLGMRSDVEKPAQEIKTIVFAGMGGSSIGAEIVRVYLQNEISLPIVICRNYTLPNFAGKDTLLFCLSYSGNTEEMLSLFGDAVKRNAHIITLGSGGKLKEMSMQHGLKHITIPGGFPPRALVGYMSMTLIAILSKLGFIKDKAKEVSDLYSVLADLRDREIGNNIPIQRNLSKAIAKKIHNRFCVIYGTSDSTEAMSLRWRSQFAENSKNISSSHIFPELTHNEITGWFFPRRLLRGAKVIILRDKNDHIRTKMRIELSKGIMQKAGAEVIQIERSKGDLLTRMYSLMYIGDFVSFYLAMLNKVDPTPVEHIEYLKRELAKI